MKRTLTRGSISPPPLKRQRGTAKSKQAVCSGTNAPSSASTFRIFSWNINGIKPFLPESSSAPITSFFKPVTSPRAKISPSPQPQRAAHSLRGFLARHHWPEVLFLQEVKIKHGDTNTASALLSALNAPLSVKEEHPTSSNTYTLDLNLPHDRFNARGFGGKLYGVATILRSDFVSRWGAIVRHVDWDLEGRVSIVELGSSPATEGEPQRGLALINVYAVNGTTAPYRSPKTGDLAGTRHDFKIAFHSRLRDECLKLEDKGFDVVIAGDLNVARGVLDGHPGLRTWPVQHQVNRADFNSKFFGKEDCERAKACISSDHPERELEKGSGDAVPAQEEHTASRTRFDGVDVFRAMLGEERKYTYHPTTKDWGASCDRVDLIIVSRNLWEEGSVAGTGIMDSPQERGPSDHVPLWVDISLPLTPGGTEPD